MKKGVRILNLGHNDIVGKVSFGEGCIINPSCSIICEDKTKEIVFGDYNIIEEKAIILVKNNSKLGDVVRIGSYNIFGIKSYVADCEIGDCNVLEPKVELKEVRLGNNNLVGAEVKVSRNNFKDNHRFFYPGKVKLIDTFNVDKHKEYVRSTYMALAER